MIYVSDKISNLRKLVNTLVLELSMSFIKLYLSYNTVRSNYI